MIIIETSIRKTLVEIVMDMKQSTIPSQMARIKFMINVEDDFLNLLGQRVMRQYEPQQTQPTNIRTQISSKAKMNEKKNMNSSKTKLMLSCRQSKNRTVACRFKWYRRIPCFTFSLRDLTRFSDSSSSLVRFSSIFWSKIFLPSDFVWSSMSLLSFSNNDLPTSVTLLDIY